MLAYSENNASRAEVIVSVVSVHVHVTEPALTGRKLRAASAEWVGARRYSSQGSDQSGGWAAF